MRLHPMIDENIQNAGQHLFGIFDPDGVKDAFCYTVGNALHGLPELLFIANIPQHQQAMILNAVGAHMRETGKLEEGLLDIEWTFPFKIRKCSDLAKENFTIQAGNYLGREDYEVYQVMICDPKGRYPGDEGIEPFFNVEQP